MDISKHSHFEKCRNLVLAYPEHLSSFTETHLIWHDGTLMPFGSISVADSDHLENSTLADQINPRYPYHLGIPFKPEPNLICSDPGRARYTQFFKKMYGETKAQVENNLASVVWMEETFGNKYLLNITKINMVYEKIMRISQKLDELVKIYPEFIKFLSEPGESFNWREIAGTNRLSAHSFGMAMDINFATSDYWQWDLLAIKSKEPILETTHLTYKNSIPTEIVSVFEQEGFIWGGKWYHYDTMHFEYRPELLL